MPVAIPFIAAAAGAAASAVIGGGILGAVAAAGAALVVSAVGAAVFRPKSPSAARSANVTPGTDTGPGSGFDPRTPGAGRTQSFRQPITEHQIVFGRCRTSGPVVFLHSATDDEARADGFLHVVVVLAAHRVRAIGEVFLNGTASTDPKFSGLLRIDRALGDPGQTANANLVADTGGQWTAAHRGQGRAYLAVRLKLRPEAFPSGAPSLSAIVEGADTILDPRTGATGWSDNPALCLAWYLTSPFGWRAAWADIDLPALMAAANICDEIMGRRDGTAERRYTVNGAVTLGEGKIAITRKLVAAMAGALVVSGGRFYIHAGAPALPAATLTSDDLRGDVTIVGSRPRRDLFNGVRAVYVEPAAAWQPTDAPPLLASNYVTEDGGEAIYRDMEFPLTTSAATVQRLMKIELERNRRQREVAMQANLSALRLRPWDGVTVALERLTPFPARVTGWALAPDGGVNLQLAEEEPAVWAWNPATDERATGQNRCGNAVINRHRAPASRFQRFLAGVPNTRAAAFRQSATEVGVEGLITIATSTTTATFMADFCFNGLTDLTPTDRAVTLAANRGLGWMLDTSQAKEFALAHWLTSGVSGGRLFVRVFDGAGNVREDIAGDVLASITTMQWNGPAKGWNAGAPMDDANFNRRQTIRVGAAVAYAQVGVIGFDGPIDLQSLRLYGLPEAAPAVLNGTPLLTGALFGSGRREFAAEVSWDIPSLAPGATSLLDVTVNGARAGDLAQASLVSSTRFIELDAAVWSNNTVRVMARNISGATFDLTAVTLSVGVTKRRVP